MGIVKKVSDKCATKQIEKENEIYDSLQDLLADIGSKCMQPMYFINVYIPHIKDDTQK